MNQTIPHWLEKQYELNPNKIAIEHQDGHMTFSELRQESRRVAAGLLDEGVKRGDHIALLADNHRDVPVFIHAFSYVGAVVVLLNTRLTPSELAFQLDDADVSKVFVDRTNHRKAEEAKSEAGLINVDIQLVPTFPRKNAEQDKLVGTLSFNQVFTMMYTSGTTGAPKAVMHTYGNHWFSAIASALNIGLTPDDKWLHCMPMFHVSGFSILVKNVIYGMTISLLPKFDAKEVHEQIINNQVTHISVVTVMVQRLIEDLENEQYPSHFRCMLLGGGPVPEGLLHEAAAKNIPVFQSYGMTETSSQIATLSPGDAFRKIGSAGKALSPAQLIIDTANQGETGEILVQGPMVSRGYYKREQSGENFFRTGDLGYKDEEGFLYVVDRVKDVVISGGENVYPAEVESVITGYPGVKEAGVTGQKDDTWGEVPVAFIVTDPSSNLDLNDIKHYCEKHLAKYKVPKQVYRIAELPRNASNKILRRELFSMIAGGDDSDGC